jgi:hypothetical protein
MAVALNSFRPRVLVVGFDGGGAALDRALLLLGCDAERVSDARQALERLRGEDYAAVVAGTREALDLQARHVLPLESLIAVATGHPLHDERCRMGGALALVDPGAPSVEWSARLAEALRRSRVRSLPRGGTLHGHLRG